MCDVNPIPLATGLSNDELREGSFSNTGRVHMRDGVESLEQPRGAEERTARPTWSSEHGHFEVTAVTEGAWRVGDLRIPEEDPLHVVAFVESRDERFEVVWLRGSSAVTDLFDSLDSALDAIDDILATGEVRNVSAAAAAHPRGR